MISTNGILGITFAIAVAPKPPPPIILTTGVTEYPSPIVVTGIASTWPFKMVGTPATADVPKVGAETPDQRVKLEPSTGVDGLGAATVIIGKVEYPVPGLVIK